MKTTTCVHTPEERRAMRRRGDQLARLCQLRLLCMVSILRTAFTQVIPLAGSAGWWIVPVCLAPGLTVYGLLVRSMRRAGASTIQQAVGQWAGKTGSRLFGLLLGALLLLDGAASFTALVTFFTEGIGTEGTQLTMALLTMAALLMCLHRDGLPRSVWLMRHGMTVLGLLIAGYMLSLARADGLHPVLGADEASLRAACRAGVSMGWPLVLLLTAESPHKSRVRPVLPVAGAAGAAGLLMCLVYPCEVLMQSGGLAQRLLLGTVHLPPALRTLAHALGMLCLLLGIAACAQSASELVLFPSGRELAWLPYALAALLTLSQLAPSGTMWQWLNAALMYLPSGLVLFAIWTPLRRKT